jgi:STE24 endopeptidase
MTPEDSAEAHRYGTERLVLELVDKLLDVAFLLIFAFVLAQPVDQWLAGIVPGETLRLLALFGVLIGLHEVISLPLSYYAGHVVEHRHGLSRQSAVRWLWRHAKRFGLGIALGACLVVGLYWLCWSIGAYWWLAACGAFFVVSVLLGQLAPVLILPLFYRIRRLDDPELAQRMARLVEGTGLSIEGIYRMVLSDETAKANAMLAGLGRTRRVLLGDTLLDGFNADEIEVVFAHEVGHHVFRHIPKMMATGLFFSALGFWLTDRWLAVWTTTLANDPGAYDPRNLPVATLPMLMLVLTLLALLGEPLQNIISRHYERQCDRYALACTGLKPAYTSAFRKLARLNKDDPHPNRVAVFLFHSHPPISERLALADE